MTVKVSGGVGVTLFGIFIASFFFQELEVARWWSLGGMCGAYVIDAVISAFRD